MSDCDCPRCTSARYETERRTAIDSMLWTGGLFRRYPTAAAFFVFLIVLEAVLRRYSFIGSDVVVFLFLVSARGYVDLCALDELLNAERGALRRLWRVLRRLPAALVARGLSVAAIVVAFALPLVPLGLGTVVVPNLFDLSETPILTLVLVVVAGVVSLLVGIASAFVVYVKMVLVAEACFVSGAGVVGSLRESWRSVKLRRAKVVFLAGTFSVVAGFLVSGVLGVESGGGESEGILQVASSVATTGFYAGLFTHLYVERRFERDEPVHNPSGGSTSTSS
jgi:hypothetical protein